MTEAFWEFDEFDELFSMRNDMERFFSHMPRWKKPSAVFEKAWKPFCDVYECRNHFTVILELAWVDEEEVEVVLHGRVLTIRGQRRQYRPQDMSTAHMLEINYGEFERKLELPVDIDADATRAVYRRGFLEITLPKLKQSRLRDVDIRSE